MAKLKCDMCHKPLKVGAKRYRITTLLRPDLPLTVGPECFRKERKARAEMEARNTPEQIAALREKIAAIASAVPEVTNHGK